MASTTITEFKTMPCTKCGGAGRIAQFQHRNGGECFRCGATGNDPVMREITRDMTDDEVLRALEAFGMPVIFTERQTTDDWLADLMAMGEADAQTMIGARMMLAAI